MSARLGRARRSLGAPWLGGLLGGLLACAPPSPPTGPEPGTRTVRRAATPEDEDPVAVDPRAIATGPLALGWAAAARLPKSNAVADARAGIELHERGEHALALAELDSAIAADPNYSWARYHRARAHARLGNQALAFADLAAVLQADLPHFGPRIDADAELDPIRAGDYGEFLEAVRARVEQGYADAAARGVIAWIYQPRSTLNPRTKLPQAPYEDLRMGVYDSASARFLPLTPAEALGLGGLIDAGQLLVVSGQIVSGDMWVVQPREIGVHLYALDALGVARIDATRLDKRRPQTQAMRTGVIAAIEADGVHLSYTDLGYVPGTLTTRVSLSGNTKLLAETTAVTPEAAEDLDDTLSPEQAERQAQEQIELLARHVQPDQVQVRIDGHGVQVHRPLAGVALRGRQLEVDGRARSIELAPAHAFDPTSVIIEHSEDGRALMVFAQIATCSGGEGPDRRHALSRVDLDSGAATLLASGEGMAHAAMTADGTVYTESPAGVMRFAPGQRDASFDVPERVHIALPGYAFDCSI